jgi:hypothetical protein
LTDGLLDSDEVRQGKVNVRLVDPAAIRNKLFAMQRVGHLATPKLLAGVEMPSRPFL